MSGTGNEFISRLLLEHRLVDVESLAKAEEARGQRQERGLVETLLDMGLMEEKRYLAAFGSILGLDVLESLPLDDVDLNLLKLVPITWARENSVLPIRRDDDRIVAAISNPLNLSIVDDLKALFGARVEIVLASNDVVEDGINQAYQRLTGLEGTASAVFGDDENDLEKAAADLEESSRDLLDVTDEAPVIRLVNSILGQAVKERVSDIHIEPFEKLLSVRFRKDGILREVLRPPKRFQASITSRIKIMGNLNIAEKRLPQDGRIRRVVAGKEIDVRLSSVPTSFGERLVLRILDKSSTILDLTDLGFDGDKLKVMHELITRPHGIILVTGPTGSGKTTTLYACLTRINTPDKNILTVEDPVEYQINGIGQVHVNTKIGLTFASGLRAFLRQDPDVILIGEIRDRETAEIAVQASLTGHLVFSTLHTNDASSAFTRLVDMGIEPFLIASSVLATVAQRLVRVVCRECRERYEPSRGELETLGIDRIRPEDTFYRAVGCPACSMTGYSGRNAIYEILKVEDQVRELVMKSADASEIKRMAMSLGMRTLRQDGVDKVRRGITTAEEVMRVTQGDDE
ncbi:MAG TPA: type II secretion system ATPase GspE [Myxococcota bacterium]|mgnify:FL=1|nr:type II secretion system ATPase GspE [Myxococcota bacterium]HOH75816.1 type II secretion system ATPase GspE [Myxococcota bacterium]HPV03431.1 type II secretion system ATPase GspE [Myxococcota bacterium]